MTSVKSGLLGKAIKAGNLKLACHLALLASIQNAGTGSVYLPNAYELVKQAVTPQQWAGYLSALSTEGKYRPTYDDEHPGMWGTVR